MLSHLFPNQATLENALRDHKTVVCATTASLLSTLAGYPLDSLKSRLQTTKVRISVPRLAANVLKEEGVAGFFRGIWIPLFSIAAVRTVSFSMFTSTKEYLAAHHIAENPRAINVAFAGGLGGAFSGALISVASAPFELVKIRRQLEYSIAHAKHITIVKPPNTAQAVVEIVRASGLRGLYQGFPLHCWRDTLGTALYFGEYDTLRYLLGRLPSGEQGDTPKWAPVHPSLIPFLCGSVAGVSSWALIYPLDVVKTKVQERALAGVPRRSPFETLKRIIRGPDPANPRTIAAGMARMYQGLGVSSLRSVLTHGCLWTIFEFIGHKIDNLPRR
ncbi:hypothetical protein FRC03_012254 [Tulasnella sp. 419]|nr:hypothetical protein FRC02_012194 [Tulasnella sp. 418]KAG8966243.1 hypothetical protein FRC03_012254 [Tulasnella sp. 419]